MAISQNTAKALFNYHEEGYLSWKITRGKNKKGDIVGSTRVDLREQVCINKKMYFIHRLIFLWHHGYIPENDIDHIDRNKTNNRIENLREVSRQCNMRNKSIAKNNKSQVTGVCFIKSRCKWISQIKINGETIYLGIFDKFVDAVKARHEREVELNWDGCNSTSSAYLYLKENNLMR